MGDESNKDMPYTQQATIRQHYKKLRKFIKLVDYFLIDVKLQLISSSTTKILTKIKEHNKDLELARQSKGKSVKSKHYPILRIESAFEESTMQLTYSPNRQETKDIFFISFNKAVELLC